VKLRSQQKWTVNNLGNCIVKGDTKVSCGMTVDDNKTRKREVHAKKMI